MAIVGKHAAFPLALAEECNEWNPGLTKRELFAAMAMQGLMANPNVVASNPVSGWSLANCRPDDVADFSITNADALIAELSKAAQ